MGYVMNTSLLNIDICHDRIATKYLHCIDYVMHESLQKVLLYGLLVYRNGLLQCGIFNWYRYKQSILYGVCHIGIVTTFRH